MAGTLTVQTLQGPSTGTNANKVLLASGNTLVAPGHVVQVQSTNYGSRLTSTSSTMIATSCSVSITPTSSSSKILISATVLGSSQDGYSMFWQVRRGTSTVVVPNTTQTLGSRIESYMIYPNSDSNVSRTNSATYLDSPATTASTTYTIYVKGQSGAGFSLNGSYANADNSAYGHAGSSTITVMEIAQ